MITLSTLFINSYSIEKDKQIIMVVGMDIKVLHMELLNYPHKLCVGVQRAKCETD